MNIQILAYLLAPAQSRGKLFYCKLHQRIVQTQRLIVPRTPYAIFLVCNAQSTANFQYVCANAIETPHLRLVQWNLNLSSLIEFEFLWLTWNPAAVFIPLRMPCKCQIEIAIIIKFE